MLTTRRTPGAKEKVSRYAVSEFACDFAGRAFALKKVGDDERRVFLGFDGSAMCSCHAGCYEPTCKANRRAREENRETFAGHGCIHTDALRALLAAGWLSLEVKRAA